MREIPGLARQQVNYCALSTGEVAVFSRWHALKIIEVSELVDHPFRWVEIEKFISKPDAKQAAPGVWTIDGKLQMRVFSGTLGEIAKDGILGAVRRNFSAKAGEVLQDSVCVYQPLLAGRAPLWGLATGGADGVQAVLELLREEIALALALCGCASPEAVSGTHVGRV